MSKALSVWTIGGILQWTKQYFSGKGVDNPRLDAEVLLSHILQKDRLYLYVHFDQPLSSAELSAYRDCVRRRAAREPVAYITGEKEFFGRPFAVSASVLIPRPETELLVETAIQRLQTISSPRVLDLGTGSGAIAVSVLAELANASGVAIDISSEALTVAASNAKRHHIADRLEIKRGDFWQPVAGMLFDAILSNPPYIPTHDIAGLAPEVLMEPSLALNGGQDGLNYYRRLLQHGCAYLAPGGFMAFEIGVNQAKAICRLAEQSPLTIHEIKSDYAGIERVIVVTRRKEKLCEQPSC